jgi:uncharacterized membrane protein (DUF485 family)
MNSPPSDTSSERQYNTRLGMVLFTIYLALYLGFVLINAFNAQVMETIVLAGLNLAIVYGMVLIVFALVLALIYGVMCRREPTPSSSSDQPAADREQASEQEAAK